MQEYYTLFQQAITTQVGFISVFVFILGSAIGSFLNVVSFRYPIMLKNSEAMIIESWLTENNIEAPQELQQFKSDITLSKPSSHCFTCKNKVKPYYNIPILGYILTKGKCSHCKSKISPQYPIIEGISGIIFTLLYLSMTNITPLSFLFTLAIAGVIIALTLIDLKIKILPDELNYFILWGALIAAAWGVNPFFNITLNESLQGAIIGFFVMFLVSYIGSKAMSKEVMGNGDLKLLAALGALSGTTGALFIFFFAPFMGLITYFILLLNKNKDREIPYGPSLIMAFLVYLFFGESILGAIF